MEELRQRDRIYDICFGASAFIFYLRTRLSYVLVLSTLPVPKKILYFFNLCVHFCNLTLRDPMVYECFLVFLDVFTFKDYCLLQFVVYVISEISIYPQLSPFLCPSLLQVTRQIQDQDSDSPLLMNQKDTGAKYTVIDSVRHNPFCESYYGPWVSYTLFTTDNSSSGGGSSSKRLFSIREERQLMWVVNYGHRGKFIEFSLVVRYLKSPLLTFTLPTTLERTFIGKRDNHIFTITTHVYETST